jgi:hypothetical protein
VPKRALKIVRATDCYRTKRYRSEYDEWVEATEAEAADLIKLASELEGRVRQWLNASRSDLLA